jgi:general secretion pathway protein D
MGFSAPRQDVGNRIKVTPHINESNQVRLEIEQESSAPGAAAGALGAVSITQRTAKTTVVVNDQETVVIGGLMRDEYTMTKEKIPILGDLPVIGFLFSHTVTEKRKANLLLVLTPYIIRSQADMRKIFERKMEERQEFLDRYFVFATDQWEPPKDYSRTNGLVEDIRQTYAKVSEQLRLEEESQPRGDLEHQPSEPIELPENIRTKPAAASAAPAAATPAPAPVPRRRRGEPTQPAPGQPAPAPGQPPAAPAPAPAAPPATPPRTELDTPFHVGKMARNVNPEARLE